MIIISEADFKRMTAHAESGLPNEACGLIAGVQEEGRRVIKKVYFLTNMDHSSEHFSLDPKEQLQAIKNMRENGLKPLGNWHSHPETPARMSEEDKRLAHDRNASYMILSLMDREKAVLHSFRRDGDEFFSEEVVIL